MRIRLPIAIIMVAAAVAALVLALARSCTQPEPVRGFGGSSALSGALSGGMSRGAESFQVPLDGELVALASQWAMSAFVPGETGAGNLDGADGVDKADFDGDGLNDYVTGAEQGLRLAIAFNPGPVDPGPWAQEWQSVTLPTVNMCSVEDAIACDLDADGALDVAAACETGSQRVEVMFAPAPPNTRSELLNPATWTRVTLDASANRRSMRVACVDWAGDSALELVVGEKDAGVASAISIYSSATPRTGASWTRSDISPTPVPVGWVMDLYVIDFDGDTFNDIVYTDKEGINAPVPDNSTRGLRWLDCTGADPPACTERTISTVEGGWKWFEPYDWDGDADLDIVACRSEAPSLHEQAIFLNGGGGLSWTEQSLPVPTGVGLCQETTVVDVDEDGQVDIGASYSNAQALAGLGWQRRSGSPLSPQFAQGAISGVLDPDSDTKFDNLIWDDVDGDGDLDAVSTEQHVPAGTGPGLGLLGFQNPRFPFVPSQPPPGISCAALASGVDNVTSTTAVTASVSPGANRVVYAAFQSALAAGPAAPTGVAGNGLTWVQEDTVVFHTSSARRLTVFRALGASPSSGTITATWAVNQTSKTWSIIECSGVDTGGTNGSGATVQSVTATATGATSITATLAALAAASSVNLAFSGIAINGSQTPDGDFAELTDVNTGTGVQGLAAEWATNQLPVTPTFATANAGIIAIEVKASP